MTKWDKEYIKLCRKRLNDGIQVSHITGIDTVKIPAYSFSFDLSQD